LNIAQIVCDYWETTGCFPDYQADVPAGVYQLQFNFDVKKFAVAHLPAFAGCCAKKDVAQE
jgi:hypothetical protein